MSAVLPGICEAEIWQLLASCEICPLRCRVNRLAGRAGGCRVTGKEVWVAKAQLHMWEEPCISGTNGSGTVFFSFCNLRCVFCQNHEISQAGRGRRLTVDELVRLFLRVQEIGAHNLNLVSPTHFLPHVAIALRRARRSGLEIPVVYNTNAYETVAALRFLEGLVDIYLPDLKYASDGPGSPARRYSRAPGYFAAATAAILEMFRQVGPPQFGADGLIRRGLIIRHLVLPGHLEETRAVLRWIANNLPRSVYVSLMAQYIPVHRAPLYPEINRGLTEAEYEEALEYFEALGLENGYRQELGAASESFIPRFDLDLAGL
ncbi:MAG: radical SAM protein [Limnochordales bacterium]|nr:radical SAM protein [Limnochordales bacterium]